MTRRIEWSAEAGRDFVNAMGYIALENEAASRRVAFRILTAIDHLGDQPTGRPGRVKGTYEKVVQKTSYIIAYSLTATSVNIVRIIHAARDWPDDGWPTEA